MRIINTLLFTLFFAVFLMPALLCHAAVPSPVDKQPDIDKPEISRLIEQDHFLVFRKLFFSTTYNSLKCQDNIFWLLKTMRDKRNSLEHVKVIFIFDKYHYKILHPTPDQVIEQSINRPVITLYKTRIVPTRSMPPNKFRYHVVAAVNDYVFDFDYSDSPTILPANEYFENMFTPGSYNSSQRESLFQRLTVRMIPAEEYMNSHPRHPSYYLYDLDEKYPASSVYEYLKSILFFLDNQQ